MPACLPESERASESEHDHHYHPAATTMATTGVRDESKQRLPVRTTIDLSHSTTTTAV